MKNKIKTKVEHLEICNDYVDLLRAKEEMGEWFEKVAALPILLKIYQKLIIQYEERNPYKFNMFVNKI